MYVRGVRYAQVVRYGIRYGDHRLELYWPRFFRARVVFDSHFEVSSHMLRQR